MVGIVVGTYSSMFVASPILLGWTNTQSRRRKQRDLERYGKKTEAGKPVPAPAPAKGVVPEESEQSAPPEAVEKPSAPPSAPSTPTPKERKQKGKKRQKSKKKKK